MKNTAFSHGQRLWQFKVMPFSLCNVPVTFEGLLERVLDGLDWQTALICLDNMIIFGQIFKKELERIA